MHIHIHFHVPIHIHKRIQVGMAEFEHATDRIRMGAERKSAVIAPENLKLTAYHEGGHALVALKTVGAMPIHKATIVPRGDALGMVSYLPEKDQMNLSREQVHVHLHGHAQRPTRHSHLRPQPPHI